MTSLSKKLTAALLAVVAAVSLFIGLFAVQHKAFAAEETTLLDSAEFFVMETLNDGHVVTGLSEDGITEVDNGKFAIDFTGLNVVRIGAEDATGSIIPSTLAGKLTAVTFGEELTDISANAFAGCTGLSVIDLSGATGLKTIGANAFNANKSSNTTSITIPESVTSIGNLAFANHTRLTEINFYATNCADFGTANGTATANNNPFFKAGNSIGNVSVNIGKADGTAVKAIPAFMFYNNGNNPNGIKNVEFANVAADAKFGDYAFANCTSLTEVKLGGVATVGKYAFNQCTALTSIIIPSSVVTIDSYAFNDCTSLANVLWESNTKLETIGQQAFSSCTALSSFSIPASVTNIKNGAFKSSGLQSITIPENIEDIGNEAFKDCANLATINYNALSANGLINSPFVGSGSNVGGIQVSIGMGITEQITYIHQNLFKETNITKVEISNVNIGKEFGGSQGGVFKDCKMLTSVKFNNNCNIYNIGQLTFDGCTALQTVVLPIGLTVIDNYAFQNCSALYSVSENSNGIEIPAGVTTIGKGAFLGCSSVFSVSLPTTVEEIGDQAFYNCITLLEVEYTDLVITKGSTANGYVGYYAQHVYNSGKSFISTDENTGYVIYDDETNIYLLGYVGEETELNLGDIEADEFEIYAGAFKGNLIIETVNIPANVTKIGQEAFSGCKSLAEVTFANGIDLHEFGAAAFYNCTALSTIELPEGISAISDNMFENCSSLGTINIPSTVQTIGISSFAGCTQLRKVNFKEYKASEGSVADDGDGYKLLKIDAKAFENCSFLTVVNIPNTVTSIGGYAFNGCTRLATVYLPDALTSYNSSNMFSGCASNLMLIAPANNYDNYKKALIGYGSVTYIVELELVCTDGTTTERTTEERLFNVNNSYGYNWVKQPDGSWSTVSGGMPVQDGYTASVWYETTNYQSEYIVTGAKLSQMLGATNASDAKITLYAKTINYPNLVATTVQYGEKNYTFAEALTGYNEADGYTAVIVSYTSIAGVKTDNPTAMQDAGDYVIKLIIKEPDKYGVWEDLDSHAFTFRINPARRDVTNDIVFVTSGGNELLSNDKDHPVLYLYGTGDNDDSAIYPYLNKPERTDEYKPDGAENNEISVINSYLIYNREESIVALKNNAENSKYFTVSQYATNSLGSEVVISNGVYVGVKATEYGTYKLEVVLVANNNYTLDYASSSSSLGLQWTPSQTTSGNVYTITKTWYIAMTSSNSLLNADKTAFSLPTTTDGVRGWTYGDETVAGKLGTPTLAGTPELASTLVKFKISNIAIWGETDYEFTLAQYKDVINYTMPAGKYYLSATVGGTGNFGEEKYDTIPFEVFKADYSDKLAGWGVESLPGNLYSNQAGGASFTVEYNNGRVQFADTSSVTVLDLGVNDIYVREGIWTDDKYLTSYKKFEISYNTDGFTTYYTGDFKDAPAERGKYTVYYNITSSNYIPLVNVQEEFDRKTYSYTLYVKQTIDANAIDLGDTVYTGNALKFNDTGYYKFVYLNGSDTDSKNALAIYGGKASDYNYTKAGSQVIALTLRPEFVDSYRWKAGNDVKPSGSGADAIEYVFVKFEIDRADNETTQWLNIREWTKYSYNKEANRPQWSTKFVQNYEDFTFRLISEKDGTVYYYAPRTNSELSFDDAPAGEYTFTATAAGGAGLDWNVLTEEYATKVTIYKATLTLENEPYIPSWKYGEYQDGAYTAPKYSFPENYGDLKTDYFIITAEQYNDYLAGKMTFEELDKYGDIEYMLDKEYNEVPAGDYVYVIMLADGVELDENFEDWSYVVHFSVVQVRNYWKTTPTVHDWYYGDYTNRDTTISYEPQFGEKGKVVLQFRRVDENHNSLSGWVTDISKLDFDSNGELGAGIYEMRAMLQGNKNYSDLELTNMYFNVEKANNSWTNDGVPVVKSWSQGNWNSKDNALTAKSIWGEVEFSVYKASDTKREKSYDISKLNSLGVGSYVLVARVAGTNDYEELVSESTFAVFEDSVGMTGLIAATMVFAVIAIGLAVAGVVMLILRNKKIEEEFRRMIKSELRRK